jgi:hypothetical protein
MKKPSRLFPAAAIISLVLPALLVAAQRSSTPVIHVWKVGSPHRGDIPPVIIPRALQAQAHRLGYQLEMRVFAAKEFADEFFTARATNDEPDILVFDNVAHIEGITTPLGTFRGIASDPNVAGVLVKVSESMRAIRQCICLTSHARSAPSAFVTRGATTGWRFFTSPPHSRRGTKLGTVRFCRPSGRSTVSREC